MVIDEIIIKLAYRGCSHILFLQCLPFTIAFFVLLQLFLALCNQDRDFYVDILTKQMEDSQSVVVSSSVNRICTDLLLIAILSGFFYDGV